MADDEVFAPRRTDKPPEDVTLTGKLFPWKNNQPVFLRVPKSPYYYLPCFSTEEKLRDVLKRAGVEFASIKQIQDGPEFLTTEFPPLTKIIIDPYFTAEGRVRWVELQA